jgi:sugar lactone lactonase YvrE
VRVLPNGNIVVTDPKSSTSNIGTVYLYTSGGKKISSFTGSSSNDQVGSGGIAVLANGNFVVVAMFVELE